MALGHTKVLKTQEVLNTYIYISLYIFTHLYIYISLYKSLSQLEGEYFTAQSTRKENSADFPRGKRNYFHAERKRRRKYVQHSSFQSLPNNFQKKTFMFLLSMLFILPSYADIVCITLHDSQPIS